MINYIIKIYTEHSLSLKDEEIPFLEEGENSYSEAMIFELPYKMRMWDGGKWGETGKEGAWINNNVHQVSRLEGE